MSFPSYLDLTRRIASGLTKESQFGRNGEVGTVAEPIAINGIYRMPQVADAKQLRVRAGDVADAADGAGARSITLEGLNTSGEYVTETLATNGASAGSLSSTTFLRLFRVYVRTSGTYADASTGSHEAAIVIEDSAGVEWAQINNTTYAEGEALIAAYSVPLGFHAYVTDIAFSIDGTKTADILFYQRPHILQTAPPYSSLRLLQEFGGISGFSSPNKNIPLGPFMELTDIGFMARVSSGTADVSAEFDVILNAGSVPIRLTIPMDTGE